MKIELTDSDNFIHTKYGYCCYSFETGKTPLIYNLYVEPKYRRNRHASRLLAHVMQELRKDGYTGEILVEAEPREDSIELADLVAFYTRIGLTVTQ